MSPPSAFDEGLARVQQFVLRQRSCVSRREGSDSIRWEPDESDSNQGQETLPNPKAWVSAVGIVVGARFGCMRVVALPSSAAAPHM